MKKIRLIAEIGCNHGGDLEYAKKMISVASNFCNCDVVKFQKRDNDWWKKKKPEIYNNPHPNPANSFGDTYYNHRKNLEFSLEQNKVLKKYAEKEKITWSTSVWDFNSCKEIVSLKPELIKIPSACNNDIKMLEYLAKNYDGEVHISTGMTNKDEIDNIFNLFKKFNKNKNLVLYACTSGYPVPFEDICLYEIKYLVDKYGKDVKEIGFSGHHLGIAVDIAALALGATVFERHFTLDRTLKGTDHAASLEPDGMRKLKRDLLNVSKALKYKDKEILDIELIQRKKLKNEY